MNDVEVSALVCGPEARGRDGLGTLGAGAVNGQADADAAGDAGAGNSCTSCAQRCTGGVCAPRGCEDPMSLCVNVDKTICSGHGGVTGVRPAFSYNDCEGPPGKSDAGPADAATDARVVFPPGK